MEQKQGTGLVLDSGESGSTTPPSDREQASLKLPCPRPPLEGGITTEKEKSLGQVLSDTPKRPELPSRGKQRTYGSDQNMLNVQVSGSASRMHACVLLAAMAHAGDVSCTLLAAVAHTDDAALCALSSRGPH